MRKALFAIFGMAAMFAACSQTVSASSNDDEEKASATDSSDSKGTGDGSSGSGSSEDVLDKDCVGEPGKPWDGTTAKEFACGSGTKLSPYIILTAEQLAKLAFIVGATETEYEGEYYKLAADIKLNDGNVIDDKGALVADSSKLHKWTPIGNSSVAFTGNFDGNGHTVSGMFINTTSSHNGLFGNSSGTVQNVTVADSWVTGGKFTAGIVGILKGDGVIKNAKNMSSVNGSAEATAGIVAATSHVYSKKGLIEKCENMGFVQGKKLVAGIIASSDNGLVVRDVSNKGEIEGTYGVGGIGGHLGSSTNVSNAVNYAKITGKEYTAGIASYFGGSYCPANTNYGELSKTKNFGKITGADYSAGIVGKAQCVTIKKSANVDSIIGDNYSGGISGHTQRSNIESAYNLGDIFGLTRVGGIAGYNEEGVTNSAYSTGKVDGDSLVGLMIGYNYNTTMADYYYLKQGDQEPFGQNNGGGVATPKIASEMKSADFAKLLGDDFVYDSGLNDGYPVLAWEKE